MSLNIPYMDAILGNVNLKKNSGSIAGRLGAFLEGRVQSQSWVWEAVLSPRRRTRLRVDGVDGASDMWLIQ